MTKRVVLIIIFFFLLIFAFFSHQGSFEKMSNPDKVNWQASWIRQSGPIERKNFYYLARKKFNLSFVPKEANLFISCQSRCLIYINNHLIQKIGLYSNPPYQYFDYLQVSSSLKKGENVMAILGYNEGIDTFFGPKKPDGLLVQLEVKGQWQKKIITSDKSWKMEQTLAWDSNSERIWNPSAGFQEIFDQSKFPTNWQTIDFKDDSWEKAEIIGPFYQKPWARLVLRPIPYLTEKVLPMNFLQTGDFITDPKANFKNPAEFVNSGKKITNQNFKSDFKNFNFQNNQFLSFGLEKQIAGSVKICFQKGGQGIVNIGYSENLNKAGFPDSGRMIFQGDRIINPSDGFCWQPFNPRSFKYLLLTFQDFQNPISLSSVEAIKTEYPFKSEKKPDFGDSLLNKIYEIGVDTLKVDMQETFMDCPVRERAQYIGDARVQALVAYEVFGETELAKKALTEFAQSQDEKGYLSANYPTGNRINIPTYALQWTNMLWEYYQKTQDKKTLENLYPVLVKLMNYFAKNEDKSGFLVSQKDWWLFIDHGQMVADQNYPLILEVSYYGSLVDAGKIAEVLKDNQAKEKFENKAKVLKKQINDYFWQDQKGLFDDCRNESGFCQHFSLQGNYWALYWETVNEDKKATLIENLLNNKEKLPESKTPYFNGFIAEVLFRNNKKKEALELIKNYWGSMIQAGATTWWESFVPEIKDTSPHLGESLAHAWGSLPTFLLDKYLKEK